MEKTKEERTKETVERLKDKLALPVVKLSIGAGLHWKRPLEEWVNHDGLKNDHNDIVSEFADIPLPDACIDFMELGDVVEHIHLWRKDEVWGEWIRLLKVGSKIHISTPNYHTAAIDYAIQTMFPERVKHGWATITIAEQDGKTQTAKRLIPNNDSDPLTHSMNRIMAWRTTPYESHYDSYTMETLTKTLEGYGFTDIDFSDTPPQELNDPKNGWWLVCTATYKGKK